MTGAIDKIVLEALRELAESQRAEHQHYERLPQSSDDTGSKDVTRQLYERHRNAEKRIQAIADVLFPAKAPRLPRRKAKP